MLVLLSDYSLQVKVSKISVLKIFEHDRIRLPITYQFDLIFVCLYVCFVCIIDFILVKRFSLNIYLNKIVLLSH